MTVLVAGNAAHFDLILQADRPPGSSEVAPLKAGPGAQGTWLPGGAARTIVLAIRAQGLAVRLWYPRPIRTNERHDLEVLERARVDIAQLPSTETEAGRCILVYGPGTRHAWSTPPASVVPTNLDALFAAVTHLVITPAWGEWAQRLLDEADRRQIPSSLLAEAVPGMPERRWHTVIVDEAQRQSSPALAADTLVVTRGGAGAMVIEPGKTCEINAVRAAVVDTTGAGDAFGGTFLARRLLGDTVAAAGLAAATVAARTCEGWGAWSGFTAGSATPASTERAARVRGALAATACGDAFGMPNSFLRAPVWRTEMEPGPANSPYHAGYPAGRITDDTEQAIALTDALEEGFTTAVVAAHLNKWFVSVGGEHSLAVGPSTKRALMAYQAGAPVTEIGLTGVTNGAAMRISPIGVYGALAGLSLEQLADLVAIACMPTHATSPANSAATALAAAISVGISGGSWAAIMDAAVAGAKAGQRRGKWIYAADVAARIGLARRLAAGARSKTEVAALMSEIVGTGEPSTESVPAAIGIADYASGDPHLAIEISGNLRGDTDTIAAMAGAVCGAYAGDAAIPSQWRELVASVNNLDINRWAERLAAAAKKTHTAGAQ
jgi:ADP-ribosylglycohydrolase/sugar/nucleoside kinase (ribokinase family)